MREFLSSFLPACALHLFVCVSCTLKKYISNRNFNSYNGTAIDLGIPAFRSGLDFN
jgi:hypothetical protein